ncbi:MAG: DUF1684 domain-containing protein [Acidobacteria bacterium]|nr:DUF1684 domain-containing protein [Acidobacteriota bacterium]MCB9377165.1 DUF1684 domain-containing protein [Holophagales bacterium]
MTPRARHTTSIALLAALAFVGALVAADAGNAYLEGIESWRAGRIERLQRPDGWLTLVGLAWLETGDNAVGSAPDSGVALPAGAPAKLGTIRVEGGAATFTATPGVEVTADGARVSTIRMRSDRDGDPTVLLHGSLRLYVIGRNDRLAVRVKDADAPARTRFAGIEHFPVDARWRVQARFEPAPAGNEVEVPNALGYMEKMNAPGHVVFELGGETQRLLALDDTGDGRLFLVFGDLTTGRETYGGGRFLYTDPPKDGKVEIDFNRAYNPPCVFTPYATCPLPPPGNKMKVRVEAGEKKYALAAHS